MLSAQVKITEHFLSGPAADVATPTLSKAAALLLANNVTSVADSSIGSTCAAPEDPLGPHLEEQIITAPGTDINPDLNVEQERTNIKGSKVRKSQ